MNKRRGLFGTGKRFAVWRLFTVTVEKRMNKMYPCRGKKKCWQGNYTYESNKTCRFQVVHYFILFVFFLKAFHFCNNRAKNLPVRPAQAAPTGTRSDWTHCRRWIKAKKDYLPFERSGKMATNWRWFSNARFNLRFQNAYLSRNTAVLTGTVGRASKRSLIVRFTVSGQAPCSGASAGTRCLT